MILFLITVSVTLFLLAAALFRQTGWVVCGVPFGLFIGLNFLDRVYGKAPLLDLLWQEIVIYLTIMIAIGIFVMRLIDVKYFKDQPLC